MVKVKIYKNKDSFEARVSSKDYGVIRKVFKGRSEAEEFGNFQRNLIEERMARKKIGLSEKAYIETPLAEAIQNHVLVYLDTKTNGKSTPHNKILFDKFYQFFYSKHIRFCHEITLDDLEELQINLRKGLSASSVNRYFASYGGFFSRCLKKRFIASNPMDFIEKLEEASTKRLIWTSEEIKAVDGALKGWHLDFFRFLYLTGCRPIEAANLTVNDICFKSSTVKFTTRKGNRLNERYFPLTKETSSILKKNIRPDGGFIFLNELNKQVRPINFSAVLRRTCAKLGMRKGLVPYGLRHLFLTELVEHDVNTMKVQALAGHKRVQTTQNYVNVSDEVKQQVVTDLLEFRKNKFG